MTAAALLDSIAAADITVRPVATPEWPNTNGTLYVRRMSALDREQYGDAVHAWRTARNGKCLEALLVAATLCNESGELFFGVDNTAAIARLSAASYLPVTRAANVASDLNGFSDAAQVAAKNDSASAPTSDSSTGSLAN